MITNTPSEKEIILKTFLSNPFFTRANSDIGYKSLINHIETELKNKYHLTGKKNDIIGLISKLCDEGYVKEKRFGVKILLIVQPKYFLLKKGLKSIDLVTNEDIYIAPIELPSSQNLIQISKIKDESLEKFGELSYYDFLRAKVLIADDKNNIILNNIPKFFKFFCNILNDDRTDWFTKLLVSCGLSYCVLDKDLIPDDFQDGYADDLFLLLHIIKLIDERNGISSIFKHWEFEEELPDLINTLKNELISIVEPYEVEILYSVGLENLNKNSFEEYGEQTPVKIAKISFDIRILYCAIIYILNELKIKSKNINEYNNILNRIKKFTVFDEIKQLLNITPSSSEASIIIHAEKPISSDQIDLIRKYPSFYNTILKKIQQYSGPDEELIKKYPVIFKLLINILGDRDTPWYTKVMINSSIAYFVLEQDVIPDHENNGYIDDLFILTYVLKEIKNNNNPHLIEKNWHFSDNVFELIDYAYEGSYRIIKPLACDIIQKVGLHKFKALKLEIESSPYHTQLRSLNYQRNELLLITNRLMEIQFRIKSKRFSAEEIREFICNYGNSTRFLTTESLILKELVKIKQEEHKQAEIQSDDKNDITWDEFLEEKLKILLNS